MWPLKRLHTPTVLLWGLALPEASVHHHTHCAPSCSTRVVRNGREFIFGPRPLLRSLCAPRAPLRHPCTGAPADIWPCSSLWPSPPLPSDAAAHQALIGRLYADVPSQ